jgi:hypothetical protein
MMLRTVGLLCLTWQQQARQQQATQLSEVLATTAGTAAVRLLTAVVERQQQCQAHGSRRFRHCHMRGGRRWQVSICEQEEARVQH